MSRVGIATLVRRSVGLVVALIGLALSAAGLALFTGTGHIDSPRRAVAWVKWRRDPSPATEAAWRREQRRVLFEETGILAAGGLLLASGLWLARALPPEQGAAEEGLAKHAVEQPDAADGRPTALARDGTDAARS